LWAWLDLNQRPHPYQAYSRHAFKLVGGGTTKSRPPRQCPWLSAEYRGCPSDVARGWHGGEDQRGTPPRSRQGGGVFGRPPA